MSMRCYYALGIPFSVLGDGSSILPTSMILFIIHTCPFKKKSGDWFFVQYWLHKTCVLCVMQSWVVGVVLMLDMAKHVKKPNSLRMPSQLMLTIKS